MHWHGHAGPTLCLRAGRLLVEPGAPCDWVVELVECTAAGAGAGPALRRAHWPASICLLGHRTRRSRQVWHGDPGRHPDRHSSRRVLLLADTGGAARVGRVRMAVRPLRGGLSRRTRSLGAAALARSPRSHLSSGPCRALHCDGRRRGIWHGALRVAHLVARATTGDALCRGLC